MDLILCLDKLFRLFFLGLHKCLSRNTCIPLACSVCHYLTCCLNIFPFPLFGRRHFPFLRASNILSLYSGPKHTVCCFPAEGKKESLNLLLLFAILGISYYKSEDQSLSLLSTAQVAEANCYFLSCPCANPYPGSWRSGFRTVAL